MMEKLPHHLSPLLPQPNFPANHSTMAQHHQNIQHHISMQILLSETLINSTKHIKTSKLDFSDVTKLAMELAHLLRSIVRLVARSTTTFYHRPLRYILSNVSFVLQRAQTLAHKANSNDRTSIFRRAYVVITVADVGKVTSLLESSVADVRWLVSIFTADEDEGICGGGSSGVNLSLPPILCKNPNLAWVWSSIATLQHSTRVVNQVDAANLLRSLAGDNDRNKKMIIKEDGLPPLLKLLKEGGSAEAQIEATNALFNLATDKENVSNFIRSRAVPIIIEVLSGSTTADVRTHVINLVSRMAKTDSSVQDEFGKENVVLPIVTFLANDIVFDSDFHSSSSLSFYSKKQTEVCSVEDKLNLKISCVRALWVLAKGSVLISQKITETKAMICLANQIEHEPEELQISCLMTLMELAKVAETNAEFRRQAFKLKSPAVQAVINQLIRITNQETNPKLLVPAITIIGSLARTFPAKETKVLGPLVSNLNHEVSNIANEAVMALIKFVDLDNFNCVEHAKAILEFNGAPCLMSFLKNNDDIKIQVHGLTLLCYLTLHVGNNNKALEVSQTLSIIEGAAKSLVTQYPDMKEIFESLSKKN